MYTKYRARLPKKEMYMFTTNLLLTRSFRSTCHVKLTNSCQLKYMYCSFPLCTTCLTSRC